MRACCIIGCGSSGKVPSHRFPKEQKRLTKWLQRLRISEQDKNTITKLRVCHKHFKEEDYSCCIHKRRLVSSAVPSVAINMSENKLKTKISQQREIIEVTQEQVLVEMVRPEENANANLQEQEKETSDDMNIQHTVVTDHELLMQHDHIIQSMKKDIEIMKQKWKAQENVTQDSKKKSIRKYLSKRCTGHNHIQITRKRNLSPIARKLYERVIKLQKEKRFWKKRSLIYRRLLTYSREREKNI